MGRYTRRFIPYYPNKLAEHVNMCQTLKHAYFVLMECYCHLPRYRRFLFQIWTNESNAFQNCRN